MGGIGIACLNHAARRSVMLERPWSSNSGWSSVLSRRRSLRSLKHVGPKGTDGCELDQHGEEDFARMKPRTRGDVYIDVGMMHTVQAPENRYRVKQHMLQVDGEIQ